MSSSQYRFHDLRRQQCHAQNPADIGRVDVLTRHHFTWRCLHCHEPFIPRFRDLRWPEKATPSEARRHAFVGCPHCGGVHADADKAALNGGGVFVAPGQRLEADGSVSGDPPESSTLSFWTSGLCSPFVAFGELAEAFLEATRAADPERIKGIINQGFGELWAPGGGEAPELSAVHRLRMPYRSGDVPDGVRVLTAGVDVQKNRLVYVVRGWGARATSWLIQQGDLWGPTHEPEVWGALEDLLEQRFDGRTVRLALVDSGFRPNKPDQGPEHTVYEFCRRHQRVCMPSKGYDSLKAPVVLSKIEVNTNGRFTANSRVGAIAVVNLLEGSRYGQAAALAVLIMLISMVAMGLQLTLRAFVLRRQPWRRKTG